MPRRGGSGGKWVTRSSGKSHTATRGKGRGQHRTTPVPPSAANFPQIPDPFAPKEKPSPSAVAGRVKPRSGAAKQPRQRRKQPTEK